MWQCCYSPVTSHLISKLFNVTSYLSTIAYQTPSSIPTFNLRYYSIPDTASHLLLNALSQQSEHKHNPTPKLTQYFISPKLLYNTHSFQTSQYHSLFIGPYASKASQSLLDYHQRVHLVEHVYPHYFCIIKENILIWFIRILSWNNM